MNARVEVGGLEYHLVGWHAAPGEGRASSIEQARYLALLAVDPMLAARVRIELVGEGIDLTHVDVGPALARALESGRLVLLARPVVRPPIPVFDVESDAEAEEVEPPPPAEHDFIEIELTDEDGTPIPGAVFTLTMPDGSVRPGITDDRGRFFVPRTDPGQCKLKWTRLHPVERAPKFVAALAAAASSEA